MISFFFFLIFKKNIFFGKFNTKSKISHFIGYLEPLMRRRKYENQIIVLLNPGFSPNNFIKKKYKEKYFYFEYKDKNYFIINLIYNLIFKSTGNDLKLYTSLSSYSARSWSFLKPTINFSDYEIKKGDLILSKLGLKKKKYICFGLRDPAYYKNRINIEKDARINTFHRNPKVKNYEKFIKYFCRNGLKVCRVGNKVSYDFSHLKDENFVDYSKSDFQSDFMDAYLISKSKFVLSGGSGFHILAQLFNVPIVLTDQYMLYGTFNYKDLFIPKLLYDNNKKKFLDFYEMIQRGQKYLFKETCIKDNIFFKDSTPDEILEVAIEMNSKIDGKWKNVIAKKKVNKFYNLLPVKGSKYINYNEFYYRDNIKFTARIGQNFLKSHYMLVKSNS